MTPNIENTYMILISCQHFSLWVIKKKQHRYDSVESGKKRKDLFANAIANGLGTYFHFSFSFPLMMMARGYECPRPVSVGHKPEPDSVGARRTPTSVSSFIYRKNIDFVVI